MSLVVDLNNYVYYINQFVLKVVPTTKSVMVKDLNMTDWRMVFNLNVLYMLIIIYSIILWLRLCT